MGTPRLLEGNRVPQVRGPRGQVFVRGVEVSRLRPGKLPNPRLTFWLKTAQALALAVAVCFTLGATDAGKRYIDMNHRLMCTCGCAEILGECNHVGCPNSTEELDLLRGGIESGDTDQKIFDTFAAKYGATVLAAPPASGFNLIAWIAPFAVFAAALLGTVLLVRNWTVSKSELTPQAADPEMDALRDRIRRETGEEGGY